MTMDQRHSKQNLSPGELVLRLLFRTVRAALASAVGKSVDRADVLASRFRYCHLIVVAEEEVNLVCLIESVSEYSH